MEVAKQTRTDEPVCLMLLGSLGSDLARLRVDLALVARGIARARGGGGRKAGLLVGVAGATPRGARARDKLGLGVGVEGEGGPPGIDIDPMDGRGVGHNGRGGEEEEKGTFF